MSNSLISLLLSKVLFSEQSDDISLKQIQLNSSLSESYIFDFISKIVTSPENSNLQLIQENDEFIFKVPHEFSSIDFSLSYKNPKFYNELLSHLTFELYCNSNQIFKLNLVKILDSKSLIDNKFGQLRIINDKTKNLLNISVLINSTIIGNLEFILKLQESVPIFKFPLFREEFKIKRNASTVSPNTQVSNSANSSQSQNEPTGNKQQRQLSQFPSPQNENDNPYPISMEDGPIFRETLYDYEQTIPKLKMLNKNIKDSITNYEQLSKQIISSKSYLINALADFDKSCPKTISYSVDSSIISSLQSLDNSNRATMSTINRKLSVGSSTRSKNSLENDFSALNQYKKNFEEESKKYYDWVSKLLSSGKSKDDKFLSKRKSFEIAKLDYFDYLYDLLISVIIELPGSDIENYKKTKLKRKSIKSKIENSSNMNDLQKNLNIIFNINNDKIHLKSGLLFTQGGQGKSGWHKQWVVLKDGKLTEYMDWRKGTSIRNNPIDISLSSIKPVDIDKRRNCFRIITSTGIEHIFQSISEEDRKAWIDALYNAGQQINFHAQKSSPEQSASSKINNIKSKSDKLTSKHTGSNLQNNSIKNSASDILHKSHIIKSTVKKDLPSSLSGVHTEEDVRSRRVSSVSLTNLLIVQNADESNLHCCECGSSDSVEWISLNLLVVFCVKCSSCHRSMGTSVSKVRSLKLDSFTRETSCLLTRINNKNSNDYYEENLEKQKTQKITPSASDEERLKYIEDKYVNKKFLNTEKHKSVSALLVHGIRTYNTSEILCSFALNANPDLAIQGTDANGNLVDCSIFEYSLRYPTKKLPHGHRLSINSEKSSNEVEHPIFDISELLLLNGARCGDSVTDHFNVLTNEAKDYWQKRIDKYGGKSTISPTSPSQKNRTQTSNHSSTTQSSISNSKQSSSQNSNPQTSRRSLSKVSPQTQKLISSLTASKDQGGNKFNLLKKIR
ncbi:hypothetical protein B5S29_g1347 [[Candida] boidinii]|nr:hypothetical protein B5S29_g1347 [[Candida] boidinii]